MIQGTARLAAGGGCAVRQALTAQPVCNNSSTTHRTICCCFVSLNIAPQAASCRGCNLHQIVLRDNDNVDGAPSGLRISPNAARMMSSQAMRSLWIIAVLLAFLFPRKAGAAISVGLTGSTNWAFDTAPAAAEWSTLT